MGHSVPVSLPNNFAAPVSHNILLTVTWDKEKATKHRSRQPGGNARGTVSAWEITAAVADKILCLSNDPFVNSLTKLQSHFDWGSGNI